MTIELSHGKARPTLPRSSDVTPIAAVPERSEGRRLNGQFDLQNLHGRERGRKSDLNHMFAGPVGRQARRRYRAICRQLNLKNELEQGEAAALATERAREAHFIARAFEVGLDSPEGRELNNQAVRHGERAERRLISLLDTIGVLTGTRGGKRKGPARPSPLDADWEREVEEGSKPREGSNVR